MQAADPERALDGQSWDWLFDLPQRLGVIVEVIDTKGAPVFPARSTPGAAAVRRLIAEREPTMTSAVSDVLHSAPTAGVVVDRFQVLCLGLSSLGALVLAREPSGESDDEDWRELERVGSWIVSALEATFAKPRNAPNVEPYRAASLQRILAEALPRGSVRKVIGAFVEALGVWAGVRVHAYAAGANGGFVRYVSPVGARHAAAPAELDDETVPRGGRMVRCARADVERLGFDADTRDVLMLRIAASDVEWLLLFTGAIDDPEQVRLTLYAGMLREALSEVVTTAIERAVAEVARDPLPQNDPPPDTVQAALARLSVAVGGDRAAVVVSAATGRQTLAVGNDHLLQSLDDRAGPHRLIVTSSDPRSLMTVALERDRAPFLALERAIAQAGAAVLHPQVQDAIERIGETERRRQFRPVDSLFDQLAAETVGAGQPASVIVVSIDGAALSPGLLHMWLTRIREQLRAGDFAGILSNTEIAVLLCDASADQAAVVSERVKQLLQADEGGGAILNPVVGTTTRSPETAFEGSLVGAARAGLASVR